MRLTVWLAGGTGWPWPKYPPVLLADTPLNGEPCGNVYRSTEYARACFGQRTIFEAVISIGTET